MPCAVTSARSRSTVRASAISISSRRAGSTVIAPAASSDASGVRTSLTPGTPRSASRYACTSRRFAGSTTDPRVRTTTCTADAPLGSNTVGSPSSASTLRTSDPAGSVRASTQTFVAPGSAWRYSDAEVNLGTTWSTAAFDDQAWPTGLAQLGYGDGDESTVLSDGGNPNARHLTYYFRRTFDVADAAGTWISHWHRR